MGGRPDGIPPRHGRVHRGQATVLWPRLCSWLLGLARARSRAGGSISIERVADEIDAQRDDLSVWAATLPRGFFLRPDATFSAAYSKVNTWASTAGFSSAAQGEFFDVADSYLVAQALAGGHTVVTLEKPASTPSKRKIKVPDACAGVGVKCVTPYTLMRLRGVRLVLAPPPSVSTAAPHPPNDQWARSKCVIAGTRAERARQHA